jgi:cytochrome c
MGTGRHMYRESSLADHKEMIADALVTFQSIELATHMRLEAGLGTGEAVGVLTGEKVFLNCAACHAVKKVLAGPPLVEVYENYKGNPDGIIAWAKNPGKKRTEFAPMPSMAHLGDEKLQLVAEYMLEKGGAVLNGQDDPESD